MANLCPSLPPRAARSAGEHAELEILETLERGLSPAYTLFHSVDWARADGSREQHGEVDIVAVNRSGDVLLIEVKAGELEFRPDGIFKRYGSQFKSVTGQAGLQFGAIRSRLNACQLPVRLHHLLVFPDFRVNSETAQWPRERIVDSMDMATIVSRVTQVLGPGVNAGATFDRVIAFFENRFQVEPDVSTVSGRLSRVVTHLSAGLATWVPRIDAPNGVIRVVGTAGSGKTQLALGLLRAADAAGRRAAYLCFSRPLADHMARVAPVRTPAETFHEYALRLARRDGLKVDLSDPSSFEMLAGHCLAAVSAGSPDLDLIVVDEVQDMQPEWVESLLGRLRLEGRAVLLEDPSQQLYRDRPAFEIADAVVVTSDENFRSPRSLVALVNALQLVDREVVALSPYQGEPPDPIVYDRPEAVPACTAQAVERCLARGFAIQDIAVISLKGRERSAVQGLERLGRWSVRRFTGQFDEGGSAIWSGGDLLVESVRRFKGQAAGAVVLTECDASELDLMTRRLLFVGMTRARMHLEWVISTRMSTLIERALADS